VLSVYIDLKIISAKSMGYILQPPLLLALFWEILHLGFSGSVSHKISTWVRWHFQAPYQPNIHATKLWFSWFQFSGSVNTCSNFSLSITPSLFGLLQGNPLLHNHHSLPHLWQLRRGSQYTMSSDVFVNRASTG
jgi:hypothetical protein